MEQDSLISEKAEQFTKGRDEYSRGRLDSSTGRANY